jgi:hypothetical protein
LTLHNVFSLFSPSCRCLVGLLLAVWVEREAREAGKGFMCATVCRG